MNYWYLIRIFDRLMRGYDGSAALRPWNNTLHALVEESPTFTLVVRNPALLRRLLIERNPLLLADAYFRGVLDFEGDLYSAISLKTHFERLSLTWRDKLALLRDAWRLPAKPDANLKPADTMASRIARRFSHSHSKDSDRAAISFHYDVSNEFYRLWLDEERVYSYSCAYFTSADESLDQAQRNKLEHICRKLRLRPGERLLDIGCGWGALICGAAEHYGVNAHGITLSQNHYEHVQRTIQRRGLEQKVSVELLDYRDLQGEAGYDKLVSVGMFEHVGLKNLPAYFAIAHRLLKLGGLFLNHGITSDEGGWKKSVATEFINRYVFPDGQMETISMVQQIMEDADFEIHDVEGLRQHYALTLREWVSRLEERREEALKYVTEPVYRIWRLYMAACALQFEEGCAGDIPSSDFQARSAFQLDSAHAARSLSTATLNQ